MLVSSAYPVYRKILSNMLRPFIFLLSLVNKNTISKTIINKYEKGNYVAIGSSYFCVE